jgi:hypothetical protein
VQFETVEGAGHDGEASPPPRRGGIPFVVIGSTGFAARHPWLPAHGPSGLNVSRVQFTAPNLPLGIRLRP